MNRLFELVKSFVGSGLACVLMIIVFSMGMSEADANSNVHVTRFWHNHQPIYWPDWEDNAGPNLRVQYAHDSIQRKPGQTYGGITSYSGGHPDNDLVQIFSLDDRIAAYQGRPRDALNIIGQAGGFAMSYTGSLIDNIRNLSANGAWYSGDWNSGNTQARNWTTPSGSPRMDLVGFAYHHSLTPLLPRSVLRKEIQLFKQAWWKAWGGEPDSSDHSRGFFPTEMAFSTRIIDVLVEEGYEWVIVASHHLSRTSPSYNDHVNPGSFGISSSPPNRADQIGPTFSDASQWWYGEPNPGMGAWNVAPYAYQLHRVRHINPETGQEYSMIAVPSDDVMSYEYGYANAGIGHIHSQISPHANDSSRPALVMPSTDGDNAWGGGFDSWMNATPQMFGDAANSGYQITTIQDFVNAHGAAAELAHIEDGAWIFPEMCYGSPYFLKWIEPPVGQPGSPTMYPNTQIDIENGWALKFYAYAPKMAGANWAETAEQILEDEGGEVRPWVIQDPNDWNGQGWDPAPNAVELGWHIYLTGLDSGFQYYGGLGNDDEVKPPLAARRTVETLESYLMPRIEEDRTGPTVLVPQRFPYNPGGHTFGWFNPTPEDGNFLKEMPSEFYIWTLAYDVSGIDTVDLMIRRSTTGYRSLDNTDNETYAGGPTVEDWVRIPMTRRVLPNTRAELNALANNSQIDYWPMDPAFWPDPQIADQYFVQIDDAVLPNFRDNLFDYYIEAVDTRGNITKTDIQHVYVEDDGAEPTSSAQFSANPNDCDPLTVTFSAANGPLEGVSPVTMQASFDEGSTWTEYPMDSSQADIWTYTFDPEVPGKPSTLTVWFQNSDGSIIDSRDGQNWSTSIRDCDAPDGPRVVEWTPETPDECGTEVFIRYFPNEGMFQNASEINIHIGFNGWIGTETLPMTQEGIYWEYVFNVPEDTYEINFVFNSGDDWDNNSGNNWSIAVTNCSDDGPEPTVATIPEEPEGCDPIEIRYNPQGQPIAGASEINIHIGHNGWIGTETLPMTPEGNIWTFTYNPPAGTEVVNFVFNDGEGNWDNNGGNDWFVNVVDCDGEEPPPPPPDDELQITSPAENITVSNEVDSVDLAGISEGLISDITWTNALTGGSGSVPASSEWSIPGIPLNVGANAIMVWAEIEGNGNGGIVAQDEASNYSDWAGGDNEGTGFSPWTINVSGEQAGSFIGGSGFGMWSHEGDNGVEILRPFASPLTVDQTFHVRMQNGWIWEDDGSVGVALRDSEGDTLWQLYFNGGDDEYSITDDETDIGWTDAGIDIAFTVTGAGAYSVVVHPDGSAARTYTGTFSGSITEFRAWSWNNGEDGENSSNWDYFVNNLAITEENGNGTATVSDSVTVTREDDEEVPPEPGIVITDPENDIVVPNATDSYSVSGTAAGFSGMIYWDNSANSESGSILFAESWTIPNIQLAEGSNLITVTSSAALSPVMIIDMAAHYTNWSTGSNEASGFGAWNLFNDGENSGHFLWTSTENGHGDIDTLRGDDPVSFGMFGHSSEYSNAERAITAWDDGFTFSIDIAVQWRDGNSGISFFNDPETLDETTEIWNLNITNDGYGDTGFDYAADMILTIEMTQSGADLDVAVTSSEGGSWDAAISNQTLAAFRLYTGGDFPEEGEDPIPQNAGERNLYFNNLLLMGDGGEPMYVDNVTITRLAIDPGDSNGDGVPDDWYNAYAPGADVNDPDVGETMGDNGHTLRDSFLLNLDPREPEQTFKFDAVHMVDGQMQVDWGAGQGHDYVIEYTPSLTPPTWIEVGAHLSMPGSGVGRATRQGDEVDLNGAVGYYRIRLLP